MVLQEFPTGTHREFSTAYDDTALDGRIIILARQASYLIEVLLGSHEEHQVARHDALIAVWYYSLSVTSDSHDMESVTMGNAYLLESMPHQLIVFVDYFLVKHRV